MNISSDGRAEELSAHPVEVAERSAGSSRQNWRTLLRSRDASTQGRVTAGSL